MMHNLALGVGTPTVTGGNLTWVVVVAVIALMALAVAGWLVRDVLAASQGTPKMQEIATAVQEGAAAYLRRQFRTLSVFVVLIFFVLLVLPGGQRVRPVRAVDLLPCRGAVLGDDRLHRHVAGGARQRPGGGRGQGVR